jgi:hypothetical protein
MVVPDDAAAAGDFRVSGAGLKRRVAAVCRIPSPDSSRGFTHFAFAPRCGHADQPHAVDGDQ